jgi:hypothetical protein
VVELLATGSSVAVKIGVDDRPLTQMSRLEAADRIDAEGREGGQKREGAEGGNVFGVSNLAPIRPH